jgi:hypothetical protein
MLDDVTRRAFIIQAKNQQKADFTSIERLIRKRGITKLFHFTHVGNLSSILVEGIKPRLELSRTSKNYEQSDPDRYDGFLESFSVSLSKPNAFLFSQKSKEKAFRLVVLEIAANSLLTQSFVAFPTNAASSSSTDGVKKKPQRYLGFQGLSGLFLENSFRNKLRLPDNEPTDLQAEILFFETIEPLKIRKIHIPGNFPVESRQIIEGLKVNFPEIEFEHVCNCGILEPWAGEFRKYSTGWEIDG